MSDNKALRNGSDAKRISLTEDYEVRYWTAKLGVTREGLERAVKAVGHQADQVERWLRAQS